MQGIETENRPESELPFQKGVLYPDHLFQKQVLRQILHGCNARKNAEDACETVGLNMYEYWRIVLKLASGMM